MKTAKRKRRHKFMPADAHACAIGLILITIICFSLCRFFDIQDGTGILCIPVMFIGVILRCLWDWIFVIYAVVSTTVKYILERGLYYVGICKRHISNDIVNRN